MEIQYSKAAEKALKQLEKPVRSNIISRIDGLLKTPPEGDIKPLQGEPGSFRLRVGKYRILYQMNEGTLLIDKVGVRGDIYK